MATVRRTGTQTIERSAALLREIAARGRFGWRLLDLAERCQLDRGTTHRILQGLVRERLVQQRSRDRHYLPGRLLFELSLAVPGCAAFQAACRPALVRLSRRFDALAIGYLRSGTECVCTARVGQSVFAGLALEVGTRRPLITGAGGAAMLAAMPEEESAAVIAQNLKQMRGARVDLKRRLTEFAQRARKLGYASNLAVTTPGLHAFGVAVRDADNEVFAAIVLSGHAEDFRPVKAGLAVQALMEEAGRLESDARRLLDV
jgi:DNA-binding IclR family transcriptional regulator